MKAGIFDFVCFLSIVCSEFSFLTTSRIDPVNSTLVVEFGHETRTKILSVLRIQHSGRRTVKPETGRIRWAMRQHVADGDHRNFEMSRFLCAGFDLFEPTA